MTHRLLTASGVIVVALGAVMINRGLILTGSGADLASLIDELAKPGARRTRPSTAGSAAPKTQTIEMEANGLGFTPTRFTLLRGVPVKWVINATQVTTCNNRIVVPSLKLEFDFKPGRQTIEFTPRKDGRHSLELLDGHDARRVRRRGRKAGRAIQHPRPSPRRSGARLRDAKPVARRPPCRRPIRCERGDTLRAIAKRLYGDERRWRDIAAANPALNRKKLRQGQIINLPADAQP